MCLPLTDPWTLKESKEIMFALIKGFFKTKEKH